MFRIKFSDGGLSESISRVSFEHLMDSGLTQLDDFWGRGAPPKIVQTLGFSWAMRKSWD